jgi:exonuclease SbcC
VFRARLAVDGFADEAAWSSALWTDADLRRARSEREILRKDETSLAALRAAWKQDDTALRASPDRSERALADVDGELADAEVRRSAAHDDAIRLQGDLDHDDRLRQNLGMLLRRLEEARLMATRWNSLNRWFGGMGGDNFRRYAQCLTLQELVEKANPHLSRMSNGRYRLVWTLEDMEAASRPESDLLLPLVRDAAQANEKRPLANLSGGERFQVSLSLALGLSEMNAEGVSIESLFLDEGFGTLDGEALERAIDTLEAVQRAGCLLGIISHIEDVARRFQHTRIVVERRGGGHSVLSGIGVRRPRPAPSGASPREEG